MTTDRESVITAVTPLGFPWATRDPFLFCAHHDDHYPRGDEQLGPAVSLAGRPLGSDFELRDGFRMYHGQTVPGFPQHPHRGFETVTLVRRGFIDHSDSLGAAARFGAGDVQWLTAGRGIVHAEMFPLLDREEQNPLELFQIWLNLPRAQKMVEPHFAMFWRHAIPTHVHRDDAGRATVITTVAGALGSEQAPPPPPPSSWANQPGSEVAIWTLAMEPSARFILARARPGLSRTLYFFRGQGLSVEGRSIPSYSGISLRSELDVRLESGDEPCELLLLQGRPIGEPVVQYGPFVMSTQDEIRAAFADYERTRFGGWPFASDGPVHPREQGRFARHADGRLEHAEVATVGSRGADRS